MPLVLMCGFPSSGKSRRARELCSWLQRNGGRDALLLWDEEFMAQDKNTVFEDPAKEKMLRATMKSEVERKINKENVVILDSSNYIKGYRYELYCVIKHSQTPHCVIHCDTALDTCREWNAQRPVGERFHQDRLNDLAMRFESPDGNNRWDRPLFTVQPEDELPCQTICDALFLRRPPPPNQSTLNQPISSSNFLYDLDKVTQESVNLILDAQRSTGPGDPISIPGTKKKLQLKHILTSAELRRLRRQFISFAKLHLSDDPSQLVCSFVDFIAQSTE
uniref:protein KTI12 homolog n=1 Tax=Myxine glutinosa TaxID=7769 RepID=UPI00358F379B